MNELLEKAKAALRGLRAHWTTPAQGYYVPHRETAGLSIGMFGYYMALRLSAKILLVGSNVIIAQALHVDPVHVTVMNVAATMVGLWFTLIRSHWVDNAHSREGRFRPFMKFYGIPYLAFAAGIVWFPFHLLPNGGEAISAGNWGSGYWMKAGILLALFLGMQFFLPIYRMGFDNIIMVMSPNSQERLNIQVITAFVWSNAPAAADVLFNLISGRFTNSLADIRLYRYAYIPVCLLGLAISYAGYISAKERVVQSRAHVSQMSLRETFREVSRNRNFWILCASQWAGFLEGNSEDLLNWTYIYQQKLTAGQFTLYDQIWRSAAGFTFWVTPLAGKKLGKRTLLIACNLLNIALLAFTYNTFHRIPALVAFRFLNFFCNSVLNNIRPALNADVRDAQQYLSGERIDGMFNVVDYAERIIGMGTSFVTPFLWRRGGIYEGNGAVDFDGNKSMWAALRDADVFDRVSRMMIATSVIGAVMNVIPLFFYDLTESRQRGMAKALKLRAMLEDYANGILKPEVREECARMILDAREGIGNEEENSYVLKELGKYGEPEMRRRLALAREIADGGYKGILEFDPVRLALSKEKEEKLVLREMMEARRSMARFFPDGNPEEPDIRALDALYETQPKNRREARELRLRIQALEQERILFHRSTKPYIKAKQLLADQANAARLDEIFASVG